MWWSLAQTTCCLPLLPHPSAQSCSGWHGCSHTTPFCPHKKVSAHLMTLWVRGCMGQVLTSVLWSIIYADSQNGALVSNLTNFQLEERMQSITALSRCVASKGLSPTLVSSAEHRPRQPYESASSCILQLFNISALTETCCDGILCFWGSQDGP